MSERRRGPRELFLSHSSVDRRFATEVAGVLRHHGLPVWYSETNIKGAQQWHDEIGAAPARCDWFLLVLSPAAIESSWVRHELLFALGGKRYEQRIVPVLFKPCDRNRLSWTLGAYQFVDFTRSRASGYRELLRVFGYGYPPIGRREASSARRGTSSLRRGAFRTSGRSR